MTISGIIGKAAAIALLAIVVLRGVSWYQTPATHEEVAANVLKEQAKAETAAHEQQEQAARWKKYADDEARKKLSDEQALIDKEKRAAAEKGVSVETYRWANITAFTLYDRCKSDVVENARYGGRSDWGGDYDWSINRTRTAIIVIAADVRIKNAYGTEEYVKYTCSASLKAGHTENPHAKSTWEDWAYLGVDSVVPLHGLNLR
jgi:hypothetical protein